MRQYDDTVARTLTPPRVLPRISQVVALAIVVIR